LHNDTWLKIDVVDANDEIPQFIGLDENGRYAGSVAENLEPGAEVIAVTATDKDEFPDYKKVSRSPVDGALIKIIDVKIDVYIMRL
jgi:hypothetical protein